MKTVLSFVKPYKWPAAIAILLMFIEVMIELLQPLIIATIIDDGIVANDRETIWYWGILLIVLALFSFLIGVLNSYFSAHVAQSFSFDLRKGLFNKIQSFTMATYLRFPTSALITRLTSDVQQVQTVLFMSLRIMLKAPLATLGSLVMAFLVNAKMASFLLIGVPLVVLFLFYIVKKGVRLFAQVQRKLDRVNRVLQENLQAVRLVKAYMRMDYEEKRFGAVSEELKTDTMHALRIMELIMPILFVVMNLSLLAAIWFGAMEVRSGDVQVGELVAVVNYAMRMTGFFSMFAFIINTFSRGKASAQRLEEILLVEEGLEKNERVNLVDIGRTEEVASLRFEGVSFKYPNTEKYVLKNVSFTVRNGEKLAIMGATGAGKTTLLNLIPRFYEPTAGAIYINDRNINEWSLQHLRETIGFVPQQSILFTGSINENIRWGKENVSIDEVHEATIQAQIHETIQGFPSEYETRVGQKGVNLSGGQKQRLSIARALIRKSQILLLDDSTSALDVKTENAFWEAVEGKKVTMLVVTQKISTAKGADNILLLDDGQVVAYGPHNELIKTNELYKQIAQTQGKQVGDA